MAGIIWLASYPKSGNTWARIFFENLLSEQSEPIEINKVGRFCLSDTSRPNWERSVGPRLNELRYSDVLKMRPQVLSYLTGLSEGGVLMKSHTAHVQFEGMALIPPEYTAGAIYILRNPLDIVLSLSHFWGRSTLETVRRMADEECPAARDDSNVASFLSSWSTHVRSWTQHSHPRLLMVRYEDMLDRPLDTFGHMARHVGLEPGRLELEQAIQNSSFDRLQSQEIRAGFREAPKGRSFFRRGASGQWRDDLQHRYVDRIVRKHGAVMELFDYLPDRAGSVPPLEEISRDQYPRFDCSMPLVPPGPVYRPMGQYGLNIRL